MSAPCRQIDLRWLSPNTRTIACSESHRSLCIPIIPSSVWARWFWALGSRALRPLHDLTSFAQLSFGLASGQCARGLCGGSGIAVGWSSGAVVASVSHSSQLWHEVALSDVALPTSPRRCRYSDTTARPTITPTSSSCQVMPLPTLVLCLFGKRVARQDRLRPTCSPT